MSKLAKMYKPRLDRLGEEPRHDALLNAIYHPEFDTKVLKLRLDLLTQVVRTRLLFVVLQRFDRNVAFSPSLPGLWFEVNSGD